MNPLRILPESIHLLKDGKAIQFVDQPEREIRCTSAAQTALGMAVSLSESGKVYYLNRRDLSEALDLKDTSTDDELSTELIWHMIQSVSEHAHESHPQVPGAKEYLISQFYESHKQFEESEKWMQRSKNKHYIVTSLSTETLPSRDDVTLLIKMTDEGDGEAARLLVELLMTHEELLRPTMPNFDEMVWETISKGVQLHQTELTRYAADQAESPEGEKYHHLLVDTAKASLKTSDVKDDAFLIGLLLVKDDELLSEGAAWLEKARAEPELAQVKTRQAALQKELFQAAEALNPKALSELDYYASTDPACEEKLYEIAQKHSEEDSNRTFLIGKFLATFPDTATSAINWFRKAQQLEHPLATLERGKLFLKGGTHLDPDRSEAIYHFSLCMSSGIKEAIPLLVNLAKEGETAAIDALLTYVPYPRKYDQLYPEIKEAYQEVLPLMSDTQKSTYQYDAAQMQQFVTALKLMYTTQENKSNFVRKYGTKYLSILAIMQLLVKEDPEIRNDPIRLIDIAGIQVIKRFGHSFSIDGGIKFDGNIQQTFIGTNQWNLLAKDRNVYEFTGASSIHQYFPLLASLSNFLHTTKDLDLTLRESQIILEAMENGIKHIPTAVGMDDDSFNQAVQNALKTYQEKKPVVIQTGWDKHAFCVVIDGDYVTIANRGDRATKKPHSRVFKLRDPALITEANLAKIVQPLHQTQTVDEIKRFFDTGIIQDLNLEPVYEIYRTDQKVGNCTYVNTKAAFEALLLMAHFRRIQSSTTNDHETFAKAISTSRNIYKRFSIFDRIEVLKEMNELFKTVNPRDMQFHLLGNQMRIKKAQSKLEDQMGYVAFIDSQFESSEDYEQQKAEANALFDSILKKCQNK